MTLSLVPHPVNLRPAKSARAVLYLVLPDVEPDPFDQRLFATPAGCLFSFTGNVSLVYIPKPRIQPDLPGAFKGLNRRDRLVDQLIGRMKAGHVPGDVLAHGPDEPGELPEFVIRIVVAGNDERGDLDPDAVFLVKPDRIEHVPEPRTANIPVKNFGKSLQVDVRRME